MHIFLTGPKHIGKSTIVNEIIKSIDLPVGGFCTYFEDNRQNVSRRLLMCSPEKFPSLTEKNIVFSFRNNEPLAESCRFDQVGVPLLKEASNSARLIIMDECGRLEKDAFAFQQEVLNTIDGNIPVLGVIAHDKNLWTSHILEHPRVSLITVNYNNRDYLPPILLNKLRQH